MKPGNFSKDLPLGVQGEAFAALYLKGLKYKVLQTNYRCRCGEIDVIAKDGSVLVFVEVKTRRGSSYGSPQLSVTPFKQRQISKTALTYLLQNRLMDEHARFDVIALVIRNGEPIVTHIKDAFELAY
jgi:putative endonuclease